MSLTRAISLFFCAAIVSGSATYWVCQKYIARVTATNTVLRRRLQQSQIKASNSQAELESLQQEMKTNASTAAAPTGFYAGDNQSVFVPYGTSNLVWQSFMRALMTSAQDPRAKGEAIFQKVCAACHQRDGMGKDGVAPPLVGSEWALAPKGDRLARIVLNGLTGPITVRGRTWNLAMPPWRQNLDDDAIAVTLTYIRTSLGSNQASSISADLVGDARQETHPNPETVAELSQIPAE